MRKNILILCLSFTLGVVLIVGGCGFQEEAGLEEQILQVAMGTDINTWDIDKFPDGDARFVWSKIYETLVRLDTDLNLIPGLAQSWETTDNGKTWIFKLRENVRFHDGTPFTAGGRCLFIWEQGLCYKYKNLTSGKGGSN
ncbi:MAG: ABC transporter substrate-binding protein [Candidatus Syntrophopropionicum ammoniitolerans]